MMEKRQSQIEQDKNQKLLEREEQRKKMREDLQAKRMQAKTKSNVSKDFEIVGMQQTDLDNLAKESQ